MQVKSEESIPGAKHPDPLVVAAVGRGRCPCSLAGHHPAHHTCTCHILNEQHTPQTSAEHHPLHLHASHVHSIYMHVCCMHQVRAQTVLLVVRPANDHHMHAIQDWKRFALTGVIAVQLDLTHAKHCPDAHTSPCTLSGGAAGRKVDLSWLTLIAPVSRSTTNTLWPTNEAANAITRASAGKRGVWRWACR